MSRLMIAPVSILIVAAGAATLNFTFTVTSASITSSGTSVSVSGPATLTVSGVGSDTGTFSASGSLANVSGGNVTIPFTDTFGQGTLTGTMTFPANVLVGSAPVSGSATIASGTGLYAGLGNTTITGSGFSGSVLSGGMLSFSVSGTSNGRNFTFTVANAPVTISGTSVFSGAADFALTGSSPDTGTFSASASLTNISGGNLTVPFTVTLGHGTIIGNMTFPETVLLNSGPVSGSATITGGTGSYAGYTSSTLTASGTVTGSVISGGTLSFSISGTVTGGSAGANITYNVNVKITSSNPTGNPLQSDTVVGTITTDGTIGTILAHNIKSWDLRLTDLLNSANNFELTTANSVVVEDGDGAGQHIGGGGLTATATGLFYDFSNKNAEFGFQAAASLYSGNHYFCLSGGLYACAAGESIAPNSISTDGVIATGAAAPVGNQPLDGNIPTIAQVADAASYANNVAQGSIFIVKGSNLGGDGYNPAGFPLPASIGNVKVTFTPTSGGNGTDAYLFYLYNQNGINQIAAVLPSTVALGSYNVTVTNGSAVSAPFPTQVVQRKFALLTQDSSGTGLASAQNIISATQYDLNRFTTGTVSTVTISPARAGEGMIAYGTGLGPITGADNSGAPAFDFSQNGTNVQVLVGGVSITPVYAGRTPGAAGLDQVSFVLPGNVPTGCAVSLQVSVNGVLSNPTFIAVAPDASSSACVMPGFTTDQLARFDQGGTWNAGNFSITQITESMPSVGTVKLDMAGGAFAPFTGFQIASASRYAVSTSTQGSCQVIHVVGSASQLATGGNVTGLDAGTITLNGPAASKIANQALTKDPTSFGYSLNIATEGVSVPGQTCSGCTVTAGTYTLSGAGGKDVVSFTTSITIGSPLNISPALPSTVVRSAGLPISWTGGNATDIVQITGYAGTTTGSGTNATVDDYEFICTTTAGTGGFTVPSSVLLQLPAVNASASNASGFLQVSSSVPPVSFRPSLTAGGTIDVGAFTAWLGVGGLASYQ